MNTTAQIIGGLGATELLIIGAIIVMMFGASKLPELARGSGQALRIFKSETKGLMDDDATDKDKARTTATDGSTAQTSTTEALVTPVAPAAPIVTEPVVQPVAETTPSRPAAH